MSNRRVYRILPTGDGNWKVKENNAYRAVKIFVNKIDALALAKQLAKTAGLGQVVVHNNKGVIQTEYTYGKDPEITKG